MLSPDESTEYPDHVTVLKHHNGKYYAAAMTWDQHQEIYCPAAMGPTQSKWEAEREAAEWAKSKGVEYVFR